MDKDEEAKGFINYVLRSSANAEGPSDALVSRNLATTNYPI